MEKETRNGTWTATLPADYSTGDDRASDDDWWFCAAAITSFLPSRKRVPTTGFVTDIFQLKDLNGENLETFKTAFALLAHKRITWPGQTKDSVTCVPSTGETQAQKKAYAQTNLSTAAQGAIQIPRAEVEEEGLPLVPKAPIVHETR